jgi:hypothetical protein
LLARLYRNLDWRVDSAVFFGRANMNHGERTNVMRTLKQERRWVRVKALAAEEKAAVAAACERVIAEFLKPRFLPEIRPTPFNYPVDIFGRWRGSKYSFVTRYRSGFPDNAGEEFDSAFTRFDHLEECLGKPASTSCGIGTPDNGGGCMLLSRSTRLCA